MTAYLLAALLLTAHGLSYQGDVPRIYLLRTVQLSVFCHLLVAVAVHWNRDNQNGFWQFNWLMFTRFATGVFYTAVLYAGLAFALWSADQLLGLKVEYELYADLWVLLAFLYNTWFFLAGIPGDVNSLDRVTGVPRVAKVFATRAVKSLPTNWAFPMSTDGRKIKRHSTIH